MIQRTNDPPGPGPAGTSTDPSPAARPTPIPVVALTAAAAAALACAGLLGWRLVAIAPAGGEGTPGVDQVVELAVLAAGAVVAGWLAAGLTAAVSCAAARLVGRRWSAGERFVARHAPTVVRHGLTLAVGAGVGVVSAVSPALAQPADPPADLGWVATQGASEPAAAPTTTAATVAAPPGATAAPAPAPAPATVTVSPGDTLWAIAAERLPADAIAADIAARWPHWYETNRAVIGDDPHQIRPGQVLTAPPAPAGQDSPGGAS